VATSPSRGEETILIFEVVNFQVGEYGKGWVKGGVEEKEKPHKNKIYTTHNTGPVRDDQTRNL